MNFKTIVLGGLVLACGGLETAHAQYSKMPSGDTGTKSGSATSMVDTVPSSLVPTAQQAGPMPMLSDWITYCQNGCHFPLGRDGSIQYELYARPGFVFPVGGGFFGHTLQDGWAIQAVGERCSSIRKATQPGLPMSV